MLTKFHRIDLLEVGKSNIQDVIYIDVDDITYQFQFFAGNAIAKN